MKDHIIVSLINLPTKFLAPNVTPIELELLATLPEHQGRGAGGKLIRWGLEQADRDGLATYVEAFAAGVPVYEHFGWKNLSKVVIIGGHFAEFCMVRPAPDGHE